MSTPPKYHRLTAAERREQLLDVANALLAERVHEEEVVGLLEQLGAASQGH